MCHILLSKVHYVILHDVTYIEVEYQRKQSQFAPLPQQLFNHLIITAEIESGSVLR